MMVVQAPAGSDGAALSLLGRECLSRLAYRAGLDCPVAGWSPRGSGPPQHPALPRLWTPCLSHSGVRVVAGLATCPVGLDLEHARPRHAARLDELVELLPEPEVRHAIRAAPDPIEAFYRAWTLHEALYKQAWLSGAPHESVLATRLTRLAPRGDIHAWMWQADGWTLAIAARARLMIHSLPSLPLYRLQEV